MMVANHAAKKGSQRGGDQRDVPVTSLMQKPLRKRLKTTRGNDDAMPLRQMRLQLFEASFQKDWLGTSKDGFDMLLREDGELLR
jgi:hypothetical protein